ncbi:oligopeptide transport system ATP-binding protein [Panacagrimonas perspica]|uniref:Oligopeptide transport system ATP-binding protein n=1 Tax=Panacagrimonas perspica TaxID=381431 RepID=A0A4S3K2X6_9GAMM|nr:ABC transporter ATP-binding protein [Panacagrimonas perspica]TDU28786.1 oligopeptide transport system ATP-binding protein [Panacagrimonas perspica]THD02375.1 ABC transporter ATP-binding protein [Panacagrimonas perspica]
MTLLDVRDLSIRFKTPEGVVQAVEGLSFALAQGGTLGIVGESGAGKSQTAMAVLGLLARNAKVSGSIRFEDRDLLKLPESQLSKLRGNRIAMVFQDPMTSLNPYLRVEVQLGEVLERHRGLSRSAARAESLRLMQAVHIPDAAQRLRSYPHELSGGQRQRVMIAIALACQPALLLADEPTTALDVTVQAQILRLFAELKKDFGVAMILITHDLGVVAEVCEHTMVMYAGRAVESGATQTLLNAPAHPYTRALLEARPRIDTPLTDRLLALRGQPPNLLQLPPGCAFAPRCPIAVDVCTQSVPALRSIETAHLAACIRV